MKSSLITVLCDTDELLISCLQFEEKREIGYSLHNGGNGTKWPPTAAAATMVAEQQLWRPVRTAQCLRNNFAFLKSFMAPRFFLGIVFLFKVAKLMEEEKKFCKV